MDTYQRKMVSCCLYMAIIRQKTLWLNFRKKEKKKKTTIFSVETVLSKKKKKKENKRKLTKYSELNPMFVF